MRVVQPPRTRCRAILRGCALALALNAVASAAGATRVEAAASTTGVVIDHWAVHQDHGLDCEAAATEAMLSTVGAPTAQDDIQEAMPVDTRPARLSQPGRVIEQWGDPWTEFVGSVDGDQRLDTGYGVYPPPVADAVNGRDGKVKVVAEQDVDPWSLYRDVAAGHASVVWVLVGVGTWGPVYWTTWDGTATIKGAPGEHAMTLVGVDPVAHTVTLMDPETAGDDVVPMAKFESSFAVLGRLALRFDASVPPGHLATRTPWPALASTPDGKGYWIARADGGVVAFGDAALHGQWFPSPLNKPIVGMAVMPDGGGYWLVASDGGVFPFGNAAGYGSTGDVRLNRPVIGMAATPTGHGYWIVCSDGGIFPFGDAVGYGSTGSMRLNQPVVGMAAAPDGQGYWLVAADGGIFPFGRSAVGYGSTGNVRLNRPMVGMALAPRGRGYWLVAADGGVFPFGPGAVGYGSTGDVALAAPVSGIVATPDGRGYWIGVTDGGVFPFGDAVGLGSAA